MTDELLEPVLIFYFGLRAAPLGWGRRSCPWCKVSPISARSPGAVGHACGATNLDGGPIFTSAALALAIKPKPKQVLSRRLLPAWLGESHRRYPEHADGENGRRAGPADSAMRWLNASDQGPNDSQDSIRKLREPPGVPPPMLGRDRGNVETSWSRGGEVVSSTAEIRYGSIRRGRSRHRRSVATKQRLRKREASPSKHTHQMHSGQPHAVREPSPQDGIPCEKVRKTGQISAKTASGLHDPNPLHCFCPTRSQVLLCLRYAKH